MRTSGSTTYLNLGQNLWWNRWKIARGGGKTEGRRRTEEEMKEEEEGAVGGLIHALSASRIPTAGYR